MFSTIEIALICGTIIVVGFIVAAILSDVYERKAEIAKHQNEVDN